MSEKTELSVVLLVLSIVLLCIACGDSRDEFAGMTPAAEVTYPDSAGISPADEPLISFYAVLDAERPLILREEDVSTHLVPPDCTVQTVTATRVEVSYDARESSLRLLLDGLEGEVALADLPRGECFWVKNNHLALQVVRAGSLEISGAVFARYPHGSSPIKEPNPAHWLIESALFPPEEKAPTGEVEPGDFGTGTPELAGLERFFLLLQGGAVTNTQLTIQGQYTGDQSVTKGQMFYSPAPTTPAEAEQIKQTTEERIRELYLNAPGWRVAERLVVEALEWKRPYLSTLVNWSGREIALRLTWSDPVSGTVVYRVVDTVGLVRWTDFLWYVDVGHILREELPVGENRIWAGCPPLGGGEKP
ncbi:MAG TPA: hypothetical protein ENN88_03530 [Candidatus Coatesbacteria bacterium]|nr:hypothetical protein [Candidatus Coatesbacteria bacterium]